MSIARACLLLMIAGCVQRPPVAKPPRRVPEPHTYRADLQASIAPPAGWMQLPTERTEDHVTQVWVSPSDLTALGVIHFRLPLPVGHDLAVWGFLQNMKDSEGHAELIEQHWDAAADCMRFVAEGGRYRVRTKLFVNGLTGWAIFAGTRVGEEIDEVELRRAIAAREQVQVGR
ncbi:MAG: hypothetical protein H7144_11805 [Burkholderiales bacterium]|nr:hypothetical protein [Phycisphaerae bacterium]